MRCQRWKNTQKSPNAVVAKLWPAKMPGGGWSHAAGWEGEPELADDARSSSSFPTSIRSSSTSLWYIVGSHLKRRVLRWKLNVQSWNLNRKHPWKSLTRLVKHSRLGCVRLKEESEWSWLKERKKRRLHTWGEHSHFCTADELRDLGQINEHLCSLSPSRGCGKDRTSSRKNGPCT